MTAHNIDWLIIGAGPAGLQLGYYCQQHAIDYLILEKTNSAGSFFKKFPRHRHLTSINKVHTGCEDENINLRWDCNSLLTAENQFPFKKYSQQYYPLRSSMVQYLKEFAKHFKLKIRYQQLVISIKKNNKFEVVTDKGDVFHCNKLFLATGIEKQYIPNIPGILFTRNYEDMTLDEKHYVNKRVLIIGKGDSANETATHLLDVASRIHLISPTPSKMEWPRSAGHQRAINNHLLELNQAKSQNISLNATIEKIKLKKDTYYVTFRRDSAGNNLETHTYDEVIACTGFKFDDSVFDKSCKPALTHENRYPKLTSLYESVNISNLFCLGALMQARSYKGNNSGFINGFRYNISFLFKWLLTKERGDSYVSIELKDNIKNLSHHVINRVNYTSSLWQQVGFFADVIVYNPEKNIFNYYAGIPLDFVKEGKLIQNHHLFAITLEYGHDYAELGDCKRYNNLSSDVGIHPVVRHYYNSHLLSELRMAENFENVWASRAHMDSLMDYLNQEMGPIRIERAVKHNEADL